MHILLGIVEDTLSKYPTCLSQDVADLLDEHAYPQFSNCRHAKIQVRGEKKVLHHYRQWAMAALHVMEIMEAECTGRDGESFEQVVAKMEEDEELHHTIVRYCADVLGSLRREELKELRRKAAGY